MSNQIKKLNIIRASHDGQYSYLELVVVYTNRLISEYGFNYRSRLSEEEAVARIADNFARDHNCETAKQRIKQSFEELRSRDVTGTSFESLYVYLLPDKLEPHFSCTKNKLNDSSSIPSENEVSQSELKQKLTNVEKDSKVMKFFEDNKCSVCLSSYKEIFDENYHIVVPICGHPLCCKCTDSILVSAKKECPQCRRKFTALSFELMEFNADLTVKTDDKRLFL